MQDIIVPKALILKTKIYAQLGAIALQAPQLTLNVRLEHIRIRLLRVHASLAGLDIIVQKGALLKFHAH
jgi:hypothetical protein